MEGEEIRGEGTSDEWGWGTNGNIVKARGILLPIMECDGVRDVFFG